MRRILRYTQMAVVLAVLSSSIQGCYTYIPAMSRESDGIYYTASKDADRAERARYYAQQDAYYDDGYYDESYYQDEYYDDGSSSYYMTPVEQAYWSTMPAKYKEGGEVKILNTYYVDYDPTIPKVSLALGYGFGAYNPWWGFNITMGNPTYFYEPYWMWPYNYYAYAYPWNTWWGYDPWAWYGPLYRPDPWGWGWHWGYPYWNDPWYWHDSWWWHHGYLPNRPGGGKPLPPAERPPRRYSGDTTPSYDRRPGTGLENPGGTSGGIRNPSDGNRPSQGTSTSFEGYKRRPSSGSSGSSIRVPGQSSSSGNRGSSSSSSIRNGQRSGYENIRGGSSSSSSYRSNSGSSSRSYSRPSSSSSSYRSSSGSSSRSYSRPSSSYMPRNESSPWHYESPTSSREYDSPSSSRNYDMPSSSRSYSSPSSSGFGGGSSSRGTSSSGFSRR